MHVSVITSLLALITIIAHYYVFETEQLADEEIKYLAIYFVVPTTRGATFRVEKPSTSGLFSEYFVFGDAANAKWEKGSELSHVKICCVDDKQQIVSNDEAGEERRGLKLLVCRSQTQYVGEDVFLA